MTSMNLCVQKMLFHVIDLKVNTTVVQCREEKGTLKNVDLSEDNNTFVIDDSGLLDTYRVKENVPEGRSIIDISFMWNEIHRTFNNHLRGIECQFKD